MFSRLRSILGRRTGEHEETGVREKDAGPRSHWKTWRMRWSWGRHSEFKEGTRELSVCDSLETSMAKVQKQRLLENIRSILLLWFPKGFTHIKDS